MLTKREIEILKLKRKGLNQGKIAKRLEISQPAVSLFESNIKRKLKDSVRALELIKEIGIKYNKKEEELEFGKNSGSKNRQ